MTQPNAAPEVIDLERPEKWPKLLVDFLNAHHKLFLDWEIGGIGNVSPRRYDSAIYALEDVLQSYAIRGWHCTRITDAEIEAIEAGGMQLPDENLLNRRVDALVQDGLVTAESAAVLMSRNQAHEKNRAGMVWFCFFPPSRADEGGIGSFFRYWGGEALYNSHDSNPEMAAVIEKVGTPCLIEADVPIALLGAQAGLAFKVVRRFLVSRGYETVEPLDHEDRIKQPLPASAVRRVIRYPTSAFRELTGCDAWRDPIPTIDK